MQQLGVLALLLLLQLLPSDTSNNLRCWECKEVVGANHTSSCHDLNDTLATNFTRECEPDATFCMVDRVWYVVGNETVRFSINRTCSSQCSASYYFMGDRTKIHQCTSCCTDNMCNNVPCGSTRIASLCPVLLAAALTSTLTRALTSVGHGRAAVAAVGVVLLVSSPLSIY